MRLELRFGAATFAAYIGSGFRRVREFPLHEPLVSHTRPGVDKSRHEFARSFVPRASESKHRNAPDDSCPFFCGTTGRAAGGWTSHLDCRSSF